MRCQRAPSTEWLGILWDICGAAVRLHDTHPVLTRRENTMTTPKGPSKTGKIKKSTTSSSPLARKALAAKWRQKKDDVSAAMEGSQRQGAMETSPKISAALVRTVEAAKLRRKKEMITGAMEKSQRGTDNHGKSQSEALARTVAANERLRTKTVITAALKESQRRSGS